MSRSGVDTLRTAGFGLAGFVVLLVPALAVRWGPVDAGLGTLGADVIVASIVIGVALVVAATGRRRYERRTGARPLQVWIASVDALVVLALSASLLLLGLLFLFPDEHASLADRGYPVVAMWAGIQVVAVILSETTAWLVLRWLRHPPDQQRRPG